MLLRRLSVVLVALTMVTTVGVAPAAASHGVNGKICVVNDSGDLEFGQFNASAAEGTKAAQSKLHVDTETLNAGTEVEITANIDFLVTAGDCDLIFGLGFIVGGLMEPFIADNPGQDFVVVDFGFGGIYANVAEVIFLPDEAAFMAGYLAAGISETGKVGVFGGMPIPPVTVFMDGYAFGVAYYNSVYGTNVEVLGWEPDLQTGLFTFGFQNPADGQAVAADLFDAGADTVFPVAGVTGFGALEEATQRKAAGESVRVIGVDFDWFDTFGDPDRVILTSVIKDVGVAVFNQTAALVDGTWMGGFVFEGLESGGVDIAPFHNLNRAVPGFLRNDLKSIRADIVDGSVQTGP